MVLKQIYSQIPVPVGKYEILIIDTQMVSTKDNTNSTLVLTNGGVVSSFFDTIFVSIVRISHLLDTSRVCALDGLFVFDIIMVYLSSKNLHT